MLAFPHLRNAPIREAMIDIRASLPPEITVETLKELHGTIQDRYPESKGRRRWEGSIEMQGAGTRVESKAMEVDGYVFRSADGKQVVQYRMDGFTFSRLQPYQTWEDMRKEAQRLWRVFSGSIKNASVQRVAVRYINCIEVAVGEPLAKYLKPPPQAPGETFSALLSYLQRQLVHDPINDVHGWLTVSLEPSPPGVSKGHMIVDSDIFKTFEVPPAESEIWELLDRLRVYKNQVFFDALTEETWRRYE